MSEFTPDERKTAPDLLFKMSLIQKFFDNLNINQNLILTNSVIR